MNAGYVRLSRDDDKRNYVSIENQKLIINQYATDHGVVIDRWYEDDGISGYIFDRPGFQQMMADLDKDIDTVYVKDFSRLGRHNAKVLLLLDEFQERGKHLVVIDDNYDSMDSSDDTIGIKTWFNERYVKDTSKKIKRAIGARQKEGTLITRPPFGYCRNEKDKTVLEIVPKEAEYIKKIYDLYLSGSGYRKIATYLTEQGAPTPSMIQREREIEEGRLSKRQVASKWSDAMIKEILDNDFYIGTFRLKKRARNTVHGKDKRVPKEEQCIFENHHPAIIDKATFALIQELKGKRNRTNYRGSRGQWLGSEIPNPFGSKMYFAPPIDYDKVMKKIPYGKVITVGKIREYFAELSGADFTEPITAGIFVSIVAWASYQRSEDETPYWRTLKANGELNAKYPNGIEAQKEKLEAEGHTIIQKGRKNVRYYVKGYENSLFDLK
jgi:site-specific DNA recombinase